MSARSFLNASARKFYEMSNECIFLFDAQSLFYKKKSYCGNVDQAEVVKDSISPEEHNGIKSSGLTLGQTKQLIDFMCNETEFVEVELQMGENYSVRIKRAGPNLPSMGMMPLSPSGEVDTSAAALDGSAKIMPAAPPAAETAAALSMEPEKGERLVFFFYCLFHSSL